MIISNFTEIIKNNINGYVYLERLNDINSVVEWYVLDGNLVLSINDGSFNDTIVNPYTNREILFIASLFDKNKEVFIDCNEIKDISKYYSIEDNILLKI